MNRVTFTLARLEQVAPRRRPGYLDACRACAVESTADALTFDKDSECYAELAKFRKSRGVGDTFAKFTSAVGIEPCGGCKERQAKLNKLFPYKP
jgi:hypothetical protein